MQIANTSFFRRLVMFHEVVVAVAGRTLCARALHWARACSPYGGIGWGIYVRGEISLHLFILCVFTRAEVGPKHDVRYEIHMRTTWEVDGLHVLGWEARRWKDIEGANRNNGDRLRPRAVVKDEGGTPCTALCGPTRGTQKGIQKRPVCKTKVGHHKARETFQPETCHPQI